MSKPIIAVVGRPNVGKSTLFNRLIGERRSIVEDTPGVTRDRIYGETEWRGRQLVLIDTGGIEPKTDDIILAQMRNQAQIAIDTADVIVFLCDVHTGVTANDHDIATMLKKSGKPVIPCINKCDRTGAPPLEFYEFYELGLTMIRSLFRRFTARARVTCLMLASRHSPTWSTRKRRTTAFVWPLSASPMRANRPSLTVLLARSV
jgi:small GTP-binding protein